jgi:hypothetical protein
MAVDPAALQVMNLSSELATAYDVVQRQRRQLWALAALRAKQRAALVLTDLVDTLLADLDG